MVATQRTEGRSAIDRRKEQMKPKRKKTRDEEPANDRRGRIRADQAWACAAYVAGYPVGYTITHTTEIFDQLLPVYTLFELMIPDTPVPRGLNFQQAMAYASCAENGWCALHTLAVTFAPLLIVWMAVEKLLEEPTSIPPERLNDGRVLGHFTAWAIGIILIQVLMSEMTSEPAVQLFTYAELWKYFPVLSLIDATGILIAAGCATRHSLASKQPKRGERQESSDGRAKNEAESTPRTPEVLAAALHAAAREGDVDAIATLLEAGAEVNGRDEDGATALHHAARSARGEAMERLLAAGADPRKRNRAGQSITEVWSGDRKAIPQGLRKRIKQQETRWKWIIAGTIALAGASAWILFK